MFDVFELQEFLSAQRQDSARSAHYDVWTIFLQKLFVFLDGQSTEKCGHLDPRLVLAEALILLLDLESQLPGVTQDEDGNLRNENDELRDEKSSDERILHLYSKLRVIRIQWDLKNISNYAEKNALALVNLTRKFVRITMIRFTRSSRYRCSNK